MAKLSRRAFLVTGAVIGGVAATGALVGVGFLASVDTKGLTPELGEDGTAKLSAWVEIRPDGRIVFFVPRAEIGQGTHTGVAMLIAEEMEVSLNDPSVSIEHPVENLPVYSNHTLAVGKRPEAARGVVDWAKRQGLALFPLIVTGASSSIVDAYGPLRLAGATARELLIAAAAARWGVAASECAAENAVVRHAASGRSAPYADLARAAAELSPPKDPALKSPSDWRLIGTPQPRLDIPPKVRGAATFGADVKLDGMLHATVVHSPVFGGRVRSIDDADARALKGVIDVVDLGDAVSVIGETYFHAKRGADALKIDFDPGEGATLSSAGLAAQLRGALDGEDAHVFREEGDVDAAFAGADVIEALYETPYLAHACMEPMNCTAVLRGDTAEIWAPAQSPVAMTVAGRAVKAKETVTHTTFAGGGFGRRADADFTTQAMRTAAAVPGRPVKLIWSREEDIQHDAYRPGAAARMRAVLGPDGAPAAFEFKVAVQSVGQSYSRRNFGFEGGGADDHLNIEGADDLPYAIGAQRISAASIDVPVPVGYWRSVGHSNNAFFVEGFFDELAERAGADPFDYRQMLLRGHPRLERVASVLKEAAGWTGAGGSGRGRGVSIHESFRSYVGQVADVTVGDDGRLTVDRVVCVIDCGVAVNPDAVRAQMEGSIIYALSAALWGEITIEGGRVTQSNFYDYDMVRLSQTPEIEVRIIDSGEAPGGAGEPGTPPLFAALTNAVYAATGQRIRALPLSKHGFALA